jgi:hypothetical protein
MANLLRDTWTDLDSDELRLLLRERFPPGHGQYDGTMTNFIYRSPVISAGSR